MCCVGGGVLNLRVGRQLREETTARGLIDAGGTVTDTYDMDTFGLELSGTGSTPNPYQYGAAWGYVTDPNGFLQLGARYYWPEVGRFVQQDPLKDGMNWYEYARSEPTSVLDPGGERVWDPECANRTASSAVHAAAASGLAQHNGEGPGNAFQHCVWSCKMVKECGRFTAWAAGTGHEFWNHAGKSVPYANDAAGSSMDLHNNAVGRSLGNCPGQCGDSCRKALDEGDLISYPNRSQGGTGGGGGFFGTRGVGSCSALPAV